MKNNHFEEGVFSGEDARFVLNLLLLKPIFGIVKESIYYYRRRADSSSVVQSQKNFIDFYFATIQSVTYYLINKSKNLFKKIVPFIQFYIGYDILFRIQASAYQYLDAYHFYKYSILIEKLLNLIDDKYILEQTILPIKYKLFALSKKYKKDLRNDIMFENDSFFYLQNIIINMKKATNIINWRILDIKNNIVHLEGRDNFWLKKEHYAYYCRFGDEIFFPKYIEYSNYDFQTMYGIIEKGRIITFDIPIYKLNTAQTFNFYISYKDSNIEIFPSLGRFSHIPPIPNGYYLSEDYLIKYIDKRLVLFQNNKKLEFFSEKTYSLELKKAKKDYIIKLRNKCIKYKNKIKGHKNFEIWLINDNPNQAGGNGEYFFRYLKSKEPEKIRFYFVIEKNCSDFKRLSKIGKILDLNSDIYKNIFLKTDKIISSFSSELIDNPFNQDQKYIRDLIHYEHIFIQNGILKDDLSNYLNKFNKRYSLFITSSKKEYSSIFDYRYGYDRNDVILTGLPRYDYLHRFKNTKIKKTILILPTWRMNIKGTRNLLNDESIHSDEFVKTEFFNFYNNLINDNNLLSIMRKFEYHGTFCLHPNFKSQWIDFNKNELISLVEKCDYQNLLLESSLLITDYSSIFFDFGYLRKPVIYAHFDYEDYRSNHYKEGYFNYKNDGFGPICKNIECIIDEIISEMKNNCSLRKKYLRRIKKYFKFWDENNNERIFKEIIKNKNNNTEIFLSPLYFSYIFITLAIIHKFTKIY